MTTPETTITCYVVNGHPTSAGNGPGYATLPAGEALGLIRDGYAIRGDQPPPNMGHDGPVSPP